MNAKRVPDYTLERYVLGDLPPEGMCRIEGMVLEDPAIRRRISEIRTSSEQILRRYPPGRMARALRERASRSPAAPEKKRRSGRYHLIPSLAAAAAVVVTASLILIDFGRDSGWNPFREDATRIKGTDTRIFIYRKKQGGAEMLADNSRVSEKDLLQIAYFSAGDPYGVILSIDGRGTVTLHYPASLAADTRIDNNRKKLLSSAYELDDSPGFERFIFVTSRKPIDVRAAYRAAETLARNPRAAEKEKLPLDFECSQNSILLRKE